MANEVAKITDTLQQLREDVELFYQQKNHEALNKFDELLVNMASMVDALFAYRQEHQEFSLEEDKIKETLTEAMGALENGDYILLADIVQYDFIEYMEQLVEQMK